MLLVESVETPSKGVPHLEQKFSIPNRSFPHFLQNLLPPKETSAPHVGQKRTLSLTSWPLGQIFAILILMIILVLLHSLGRKPHQLPMGFHNSCKNSALEVFDHMNHKMRCLHLFLHDNLGILSLRHC